jgi:hypothetical protein
MDAPELFGRRMRVTCANSLANVWQLKCGWFTFSVRHDLTGREASGYPYQAIVYASGYSMVMTSAKTLDGALRFLHKTARDVSRGLSKFTDPTPEGEKAL